VLFLAKISSVPTINNVICTCATANSLNSGHRYFVAHVAQLSRGNAQANAVNSTDLAWSRDGQLVEMCSGSVAMVVLFGILALVAQLFYWADIVKKLNDRLVEGSGHRDID
jgi:hypothetical protein